MGHDAAKEARKRAASTSASQSSEYVSKMSEMCLQRTLIWKEADGEMNERLDKLVKIEGKKADMAGKKAEIAEKQAEIEAECLELERGKE
ncbi:hypothetical protein BAE44_0024624 [Dichanthelium oligosanthes]|uniref:Uncharacterized protein n=1 Tax=Dichanthelium oligosanthes TaxID=888268 RepID=A0A1E5UNA7_9POAL|nr:hypothetical protein BAE44_0024624 [Dichanthelium oligosanthes]